MFDAPAAIFPETNALIVSDPFSGRKNEQKASRTSTKS
jgi:hypothetical protein